MKATRRDFMRSSLGLAVAGSMDGADIWPMDIAARPDLLTKYGSGNFGVWTEDEFGLPAFRYTANQTTDPRAVTDVRPGILNPTEHIHQVGNDRLIAIASNYGHVRVPQGEGSPN